LFGCYEHFPETIHGIAHYSHETSSRKVQQAIAAVFIKLNNEKYRLEEIGFSFPADGEVNFEFGLGEDRSFLFLDETELTRLEAAISRAPLTYLDFLCALQYHIVEKSAKRKALKFDYYLLRFIFTGISVSIVVSHERGPRHIHAEDLIRFAAKQINNELTEGCSAILHLRRMRTL
jgi:hypothetical protein